MQDASNVWFDADCNILHRRLTLAAPGVEVELCPVGVDGALEAQRSVLVESAGKEHRLPHYLLC